MDARVLVTGATSGIGEATVDLLQAEDVEVWGTARSREDLEALEGRGVHSLELDLADTTSIHEASTTVDPGQPLDGLVHNAGIGVPGAVEDLGPSAWRRQFQVNLFGPVELTRQLAPALRAGRGRIVLVSSLAALTHLPYYGAYSASKAALERVGDTLRLELADAGVDVTTVQPGPVATGFQDRSRLLLEEHVDVEASPHREAYQNVDDLVVDALPTVSTNAVAKAILRGLTAPRPPTRIPVGRLPWIGAKVLTWLPDRMQDRLLDWVFS